MARRIGAWELVSELGSGGAATVWRARDAAGRECALKLLRAGPRASQVQRSRFLRELSALQRLSHPHLVQVYEAGEVEGMQYIAMELIHGESLAVRVERAGPFHVREAVALVRKVAEALAHVHRSGFLHRDLKPANVLLGPDGQPKLSDFGLSRDLTSTSGSELTIEGRPMGTPGFWAPELARGERGKVGPHTDIYGLGATLYALLTGEPPHGRVTDLQQALMLAHQAPPPPSAQRPEIDPALDALVLRCLDPDPARRPSDAALLAGELAAWEQDAAAGRLRRPTRPSRRLAGPVGGLPLLLAGLVLLLGAGTAALFLRNPPRRGEAARLAAESETLARHGDLVAAHEACRKAAALDPSGAPVLAARAYLALLEHRDEEGLADAARALERDPACATAHAVQACFLAWRSDMQEAGAAVERALQHDPRSPLAHTVRGIILGGSGQAILALEAYDRALELDPGYVWALTNRASTRSSQKDHQGGIQDAGRALELEPRFYYGWTTRARIHLAAGDLRAAASDFQQALQLDPDEAPVWGELGTIYRTLGAHTEALGCWDRVIALEPTKAAPLLGRARVHEARGDDAAARADLDRAIELQPDSAGAWNNRAILRDRLGDTPGALTDHDRALELAPDDPQLMANRGRTRLRAGLNADARSDFERVLKLLPEDPVALVGHGQACLALGDGATALADFRLALARLPAGDKDAGTIRAWIEQLEQAGVVGGRPGG